MNQQSKDHWIELYERAKEKAKSGALLHEHGLNRDSIESWHFACELGIKAAIHKQGSRPAATHNLKKLIMGKYRGRRELYLALI